MCGALELAFTDDFQTMYQALFWNDDQRGNCSRVLNTNYVHKG
jgi:hypothetical protein